MAISTYLPPRWYLAPLFARGQFSPRLLMAWQAFYFACWLAAHYALTPASMVNIGSKAAPVYQLVPAVNPLELVLGFLGLVGLLLGLGTLTKYKLGDVAPASGQVASDAEKEDAATAAAILAKPPGTSAAENTE